LWRHGDRLGARHRKLARRAYPDPTAQAVVVVADDLGSIKAPTDISLVHVVPPRPWRLDGGLTRQVGATVLTARGKHEDKTVQRRRCGGRRDAPVREEAVRRSHIRAGRGARSGAVVSARPARSTLAQALQGSHDQGKPAHRGCAPEGLPWA
jgi:hypothetical protein